MDHNYGSSPPKKFFVHSIKNEPKVVNLDQITSSSSSVNTFAFRPRPSFGSPNVPMHRYPTLIVRKPSYYNQPRISIPERPTILQRPFTMSSAHLRSQVASFSRPVYKSSPAKTYHIPSPSTHTARYGLVVKPDSRKQIFIRPKNDVTSSSHMEDPEVKNAEKCIKLFYEILNLVLNDKKDKAIDMIQNLILSKTDVMTFVHGINRISRDSLPDLVQRLYLNVPWLKKAISKQKLTMDWLKRSSLVSGVISPSPVNHASLSNPLKNEESIDQEEEIIIISEGPPKVEPTEEIIEEEVFVSQEDQSTDPMPSEIFALDQDMLMTNTNTSIEDSPIDPETLETPMSPKFSDDILEDEPTKSIALDECQKPKEIPLESQLLANKQHEERATTSVASTSKVNEDVIELQETSIEEPEIKLEKEAVVEIVPVTLYPIDELISEKIRYEEVKNKNVELEKEFLKNLTDIKKTMKFYKFKCEMENEKTLELRTYLRSSDSNKEDFNTTMAKISKFDTLLDELIHWKKTYEECSSSNYVLEKRFLSQAVHIPTLIDYYTKNYEREELRKSTIESNWLFFKSPTKTEIMETYKKKLKNLEEKEKFLEEEIKNIDKVSPRSGLPKRTHSESSLEEPNNKRLVLE